jgi:hypothetical protein
MNEAVSHHGHDGKAWRNLMEPFADRWTELSSPGIRFCSGALDGTGFNLQGVSSIVYLATSVRRLCSPASQLILSWVSMNR